MAENNFEARESMAQKLEKTDEFLDNFEQNKVVNGSFGEIFDYVMTLKISNELKVNKSALMLNQRRDMLVRHRQWDHNQCEQYKTAVRSLDEKLE